MSGKTGTVHIGTSGYQYKHWSGTFYPEDLPKTRWFAFYSGVFDTVEINNTFYNLPAAKTFDTWRERAPRGFQYVLKFSKFGTHNKKLKDPGQALGRFLDGAQRLKGCLGPILVQLPPGWHNNPERLGQFLAKAPGAYRWAVEFRDASWLNEENYAILRRHNAALVVHDLLPDHPRLLTADWVYLRFHGPDALRHAYQGQYPHQAMRAEADRLTAHRDAGRDVYVFFNNDENGYAAANAQQLRRYIRHR